MMKVQIILFTVAVLLRTGKLASYYLYDFALVKISHLVAIIASYLIFSPDLHFLVWCSLIMNKQLE